VTLKAVLVANLLHFSIHQVTSFPIWHEVAGSSCMLLWSHNPGLILAKTSDALVFEITSIQASPALVLPALPILVSISTCCVSLPSGYVPLVNSI
jgi:hypothetical protein